MSCLSAVISTAFLYDINSSIENKNVPLTTVVSTSTSVDFTVNELSDIEVTADVLSPTIDTNISYTSPTVSFTISLVCSVSGDDYEYLQVLEGFVILIDGQYVKVIKNGI